MPNDSKPSALAESILEQVNKDHAETLVTAIGNLCDIADSNPHAKERLKEFLDRRHKLLQAK